MRKKEFKAVVFDMDGVIFDSETCVIESWKVVAERHGIENVETLLPHCLGRNYDTTKQIFLDYYGKDFPYDEYKKECSKVFHDTYDGGRLPMKPGVRELLEFLKQNGYKVGLASSTRKATIVQQLEDAKLIQYFDDLVSGDMLTKSKPEPDIYLMACERLEVKPEDAIAIEDSFNGIRSAYRAGMFPIMVPDLMQPDEEMEEISGKVLDSLFDVLEWLK